MDEDTPAAQFKSLPEGPRYELAPPKQFQRHRILSDAQFGKVTVPEPLRRSTPEAGEAWQGRA